MWRKSSWAALLISSLALATSDAGTQKKKKDVIETATDQDYKALQSVRHLTGKLTEVNSSSDGDSIIFRLDIPHLTPNPRFRPPKGTGRQYQQLKNLYRQQAKIMATKNPVQRQIRMQQLLATMQSAYYHQLWHAAVASSNPNNQPFLLSHEYKDFHFDLVKKVIIRKMSPGPHYDDKGNPITYSQEKLDELKGDKTKPGYEASMLDLAADEMVKISLKMPTKTKAAPAKAKTDDDDEDADTTDPAKDKAPPPANDKNAVVRPVVTMIVILQAPDDGAAVENAAGKK